ncbi:MAG: pyrroline-5-carboxylate reductase [Pigmentiphaga sp.]|nr:pyrroline-5-carboxylate reductase [Pigmentiphaga sp.]
MQIQGSIAFIGGGNMASALGNGLLAGGLAPSQLHVLDVDTAIREAWRQRGVGVAEAPDERLAACSVWVYAVKPQVMREVVASTRPWLREALVISIAAGLRLSSLGGWLGVSADRPWSRLVRGMPNTPALVGAGITGLVAQEGLAEADRALAGQLMRAVGDIVWVDDEPALDVVTALSGSGPAYVFLFLQALIDGGVALGLSPEQARVLALGTLSGATRLAANSTESPAVLRQRVTSKGGTTAAALEVFESHGWAQAVGEAMAAAALRAGTLADQLG